MKPLLKSFYDRDTQLVASDLLGKTIIRIIEGKPSLFMITETEAYRSDDPACHAHRGKTERNSALFGEVGHTYVYLCYGIHYCLNFVARDMLLYPAGGVLIRAVVPLEKKQSLTNKHELNDESAVIASTIHRSKNEQMQSTLIPGLMTIINGPGNVTKALGINRSHVGINVTDQQSGIIVSEGLEIAQDLIEISGRIGISLAKDLPWRFRIKSTKL